MEKSTCKILAKLHAILSAEMHHFPLSERELVVVFRLGMFLGNAVRSLGRLDGGDLKLWGILCNPIMQVMTSSLPLPLPFMYTLATVIVPGTLYGACNCT